MRLADEMEKLFAKKGERTIVFGCMHHNGRRDFVQTSTDITDLLPQKLAPGEDHRHVSAVTVDLRYQPDECIELSIGESSLNISKLKYLKIPPDGPDFARRDCGDISHLHDFLEVKDVTKIYAERLPFLEKGPLDKNLFFFEKAHKILRKGGLLAFDYIPMLHMMNSTGTRINWFADSVTEVEVRQKEKDDLLAHPLYQPYFALKESQKQNPPVPCKAHESCPVKPCPSLIDQIAHMAINEKKCREINAEKLSRNSSNNHPKREGRLSEGGLFFQIGAQKCTPAEFEEQKDPSFEFCMDNHPSSCQSHNG